MDTQLYDVRLVAQNEKAPVTDYSYQAFCNDEEGPNYKSIPGIYTKEDAELLVKKFGESPLKRDYAPEMAAHDMSLIGRSSAEVLAGEWHQKRDRVFQNTVDRIMMRYPEEDRPGSEKHRDLPQVEVQEVAKPQFDAVFYCDT